MIENSTIRKIKWFWAWQDHKEEAWLEQMSKQGWHLSTVGFPSIYEFSQGEPRPYVYRLDFVTSHKMEHQEYLQLFEDSGWEHIGVMGGWQYFRKDPQPGDVSEIFTDNASKIQKYQRLVGFLVILFASLIPFFVIWNNTPASHFKTTVQFLYAGLGALLGFALVKLLIRIKQLRDL